MRRFLLLLVLGLASYLALAQPRPAAPDSLRLLAGAATPLDTTDALHAFFAAKRRLRAGVLAGTGAVYLVALASGADHYGSYNGTAIRLVLYTPLLLAGLITELAYYGRYSYRRERQAVATWQHYHQLAPDLRRHLKPRYFRPGPPAARRAAP